MYTYFYKYTYTYIYKYTYTYIGTKEVMKTYLYTYKYTYTYIWKKIYTHIWREKRGKKGKRKKKCALSAYYVYVYSSENVYINGP